MRNRRNARAQYLYTSIKYTLAILLTWSFLETILVRNAIVREASLEPPPFNNQKIFISSILWTNERILHSHWINAVVNLAQELGKENVFISIAESGSLDNTKDALRRLDALLEGLAYHDGKGWVFAPHGEWELRRIPYLAEQRNLALKPLRELEEKGLKFDKVLFLSDVVFNTRDVKRLVNTRGGEYAAACSLDFKKVGKVYDTMALRDAEGYEPMMGRWPLFRSGLSRDALKRSEPVPVTSCWNGIVVMDAEPFYHKEKPLMFRGISDDLAKRHVEGSECCLIHPDNELSQEKGVWLNPNVRVGYSGKTYAAMNEGDTSPWVSSIGIVHGTWMTRILRWVTWPSSLDVRVLRRLVEWESRSVENREPGALCLIDEMQILVWNGWAHV